MAARLDAPVLGALDPVTRLNMQDLLVTLWRELEATVFFVTHSVEEAVKHAGAIRFRPIMLSALTVALGTLILYTDPLFAGLATSLITNSSAKMATNASASCPSHADIP